MFTSWSTSREHIGMGMEASKPIPRDTPPPTWSHLLALPKQVNQPVIKCQVFKHMGANGTQIQKPMGTIMWLQGRLDCSTWMTIVPLTVVMIQGDEPCKILWACTMISACETTDPPPTYAQLSFPPFPFTVSLPGTHPPGSLSTHCRRFCVGCLTSAY